MKLFSRILAAGAVSLLAGCIISESIPSWPGKPTGLLTLTLTPDSQFIVPAEINGRPMRLRVDTGYSGIVLNPSAAVRAGLTRSPFEASLNVGPVRVRGDTGVAPVTIGGRHDTDRRMMWFERDVTSGADGVISITNLPYETVALTLGSARQGEVPIVLQTTPERAADATYIHKVGGENISVRFFLDAPRSLLSAAAGALLAEHHGGVWSGEPLDQQIVLGVSRPVRPMKFSRPISFGGLDLDRMFVRTADNRGKYLLPTEASQEVVFDDPSEIVVTGARKTSRASLNAIIGRDRLAACSSITYSRARRLLTLQCRPRGQG